MPVARCPNCDAINAISAAESRRSVRCEDCGKLIPVKRAAARVWIIAAVVAGLVMIFVMTVGVAVLFTLGRGAVSAVASPRPKAEGETWTLKELLEHANRSGIASQMKPYPVIFSDDTAAVFAKDASGMDAAYVTYLKPKLGNFKPVGSFLVRKMASRDKAKDFAAVTDTPASFAWGRFVFIDGHPETLKQLRTSLPE